MLYSWFSIKKKFTVIQHIFQSNTTKEPESSKMWGENADNYTGLDKNSHYI